jgi:hypothetical protein
MATFVHIDLALLAFVGMGWVAQAIASIGWLLFAFGYWLLDVVDKFGICWNASKVIIAFIGVGIGIDQPINHCQPWSNCPPIAFVLHLQMKFPSIVGGTNGVLEFGRTCCFAKIKTINHCNKLFI